MGLVAEGCEGLEGRLDTIEWGCVDGGLHVRAGKLHFEVRPGYAGYAVGREAGGVVVWTGPGWSVRPAAEGAPAAALRSIRAPHGLAVFDGRVEVRGLDGVVLDRLPLESDRAPPGAWAAIAPALLAVLGLGLGLRRLFS